MKEQQCHDQNHDTSTKTQSWQMPVPTRPKERLEVIKNHARGVMAIWPVARSPAHKVPTIPSPMQAALASR